MAQITAGVRELSERRIADFWPDTAWPAAAFAVIRLQAVDGDLAQPTAERAGALPVEARQLTHQHAHDFLHQVVNLSTQARVSSQPGPDQRPVEVVQPAPRLLIALAAQAFQQTGRCLHQWLRQHIRSRQLPPRQKRDTMWCSNERFLRTGQWPDFCCRPAPWR